MTSSDDSPESVLADLDAVLAEHEVDPELAERIRALMASSDRAPESHTRARVPAPISSQSIPSLGLAVPDVTQLARPSARGPDPSGVTEPRGASDTPGRGTPAEPARPSILDGPLLVPVSLIAEGGMGEVHRANDRPLARALAMKVLHDHLSPVQGMRARFLDEAQITAQLAHPGIPPVHALGELDDGRPYFTMKEVHGRTLAELVEKGFDEDGLSEHRRLEVFTRVCEAVAYAHARGVIHCDIKPLNIMIGTFGEVLVMDWGVARLVSPATTAKDLKEAPVRTTMSGDETNWDVAGTPAYMPPEQALGEIDRIGPAADVYALGVMLYELLAGERPYRGGVPAILFQSTQGEIPPIPRRPGTIVDDSLFEIIVRAMQPEPTDRYADAGALGQHVARWREGAIRREKALAIVREANERRAELGPMRERAEALRAEAERELAGLPAEARIEGKRAAWAKQDDALALERDAALRAAEVRQLLEAALVHAPELGEPKAMLADLAFEQHRDAERRRAWDEAALHEVRLSAYDAGRYAHYLEGKARLSIETSEPCPARVFRYEARDRQLVAVEPEDLGPTPVATDLPAGSYLVELDGPCGTVSYPVRLSRRTEAEPEESADPAPRIVLPGPGTLAEGEVYVPAGAFECGSGATARDEWVDAFVIQRVPVTFRELTLFLTNPAGGPFRRDVFRDGLGLLRPDWPAVGISWEGARAYAEWLSARTSQLWRLPAEAEWEKAARGVDGRAYPWGDVGDGAFCHVRTPERTPGVPVGVEAFPTDRSPYGVLGMAGNVREWCEDGFVGTAGRLRAVRGGSYRLSIDMARVTARGGLPSHQGYRDVGLRLVRALR